MGLTAPQKTAKDCVEFYYRRKQDKTTILPELRLKAKMLNLQDREGSPAPKKQCSFDLRVPETDTRCPRTQLLFLRQSSYERRQTSAYFRVFQHSWPPSSSEPSVAPAFCDLVARLPCIASSSLVDSLRCWQAGRITGQDFQRCLANDIMPNLLPTSTPSIHLPISSPHVCDQALLEQKGRGWLRPIPGNRVPNDPQATPCLRYRFFQSLQRITKPSQRGY